MIKCLLCACYSAVRLGLGDREVIVYCCSILKEFMTKMGQIELLAEKFPQDKDVSKCRELRDLLVQT